MFDDQLQGREPVVFVDIESIYRVERIRQRILLSEHDRFHRMTSQLQQLQPQALMAPAQRTAALDPESAAKAWRRKALSPDQLVQTLRKRQIELGRKQRAVGLDAQLQISGADELA